MERDMYRAQWETAVGLEEKSRNELETRKVQARREVGALREELSRCVEEITAKNKTISHYIAQLSDVANEKTQLED